jgi:hypothetical protein
VIQPDRTEMESPTLESRGLLQAAEATHLPARMCAGIPRVRRFSDDPYRSLVRELKSRYKISIRKWQPRMSGGAYELKYRDGRIKRLITAPRPRSPVSAAIFLHEVGHHAIGFHRYDLRCLEEYYVWQWAFREMKARHIPVDGRVLRHYQRSMAHYIRMAQIEGHAVPYELRTQVPSLS